MKKGTQRKVLAPPAILAVMKDPITTKEAAKILNLSQSEVTRRATEGVYGPLQDHRGWFWFDRAKLEVVSGREIKANQILEDLQPDAVAAPHEDAKKKSHATQINGKVSYNGDEAKIVFMELKTGKNIEEIVIEQSLHPHVVLAIAQTWHQIKGGVLLTREVLAAIEKMPLQGELPITTPEGLVKVLTSSLGGTPCAKCLKHKARVCLDCGKQPEIPHVAMPKAG